MDDVGAGHVEVHRLADRHHQMVSGDHLAAFGIGVAHFEPPLVADDFDHLAGFANGQHALTGGHAKGEQRHDAGHGQQDTAAQNPVASHLALLGRRAGDVPGLEGKQP